MKTIRNTAKTRVGILVSFWVLCLMPSTAYSQGGDKTLTYDMIHKGDVIGTLVATKTNNGGLEEYVIKTDIRKKILHVKHCTYDLELTYSNGELQSSNYELYINEKLDKSIQVLNDGGDLSGTKNGRKKKVKANTIGYSSGLLYFKEPVGVTKTFSETKMKFRSLAPHGSKQNTYLLDKNKGEYYYENGELQRMLYDDAVKIELVRTN